jgi:NitT/TauT family transport system substrate-binding protein
MTIRIGHLSTFYHTALLLMARPDLPARLGAEATWTLFGTGPAIMQAFRRGELDLAYVGLPPAIIGLDQGIDVRCVAGGHMEGTVLAAKARWRGYPEAPDLASVLGQFRGAAIGVPGSGSIHDVILRDALATAGLQKAVQVRNYPWADLVTEAVVRDEVAAAIGTPALAVAISRFAGGKVLYPPSRTWPHNPSYGIIVSQRFLASSRGAVRNFLSLHEEASALLRDDAASAAKDIAALVGIVDEEFVRETLAISPRYCAQLCEEYIASTMRFVRTLRELGYIGKELTQEEIFDRSSIDEVHPERDHYYLAGDPSKQQEEPLNR